MNTILDAMSRTIYCFIVPPEAVNLIKPELALSLPEKTGLKTRTDQVAKGPDDFPVEFDQLAKTQLYFTLEQPVSVFEVIQRYGRVALIRYAIYGQPDPVIPIALVDLGEEYRRAVKAFVETLHSWNRYHNQKSWGKKANKKLRNVYYYLDNPEIRDRLTRSELWYIKTQLALSASNPARVTCD